MNNCIPNMYCKSILDINYDLLKKNGIKYLMFDLDNTIATVDRTNISNDLKKKIIELSNSFEIVIVSNNFSKRIKPVCDSINISFISFAMKPLPFCYKTIIRKWGCKKSEMCMIGDQLLTDILGANKFGIFSILVDPISKEDIKITRINRLIENKIISKLSKTGILKRGKYYEGR